MKYLALFLMFLLQPVLAEDTAPWKIAISEQAGAFAALAMGLNGAITALLLPALLLGW